MNTGLPYSFFLIKNAPHSQGIGLLLIDPEHALGIIFRDTQLIAGGEIVLIHDRRAGFFQLRRAAEAQTDASVLSLLLDRLAHSVRIELFKVGACHSVIFHIQCRSGRQFDRLADVVVAGLDRRRDRMIFFDPCVIQTEIIMFNAFISVFDLQVIPCAVDVCPVSFNIGQIPGVGDLLPVPCRDAGHIDTFDAGAAA